jgi:hypothetical protein
MSKNNFQNRFLQINLGFFVAIVCLWASTALALQASGDITSNTTWGEDVVLTGVVFVKQPAVLTVLPGVTVYGNPQTAVIIEQGAKIMAVGTPEEPIVFTSNKPAGSRARGDWGGVVLNGYAPINNTGGDCTVPAVGEAGMGVYGGCNPHDSSGILRYVRIEYGGFRMDGENEFNALTLQGVGDETIIEYVQCDQNDDDGIEFFGGTANARNILNSRCADDHFDWTNGYMGKAQFIVAHKADDDGDRGIEGDNLKSDNNAQPVSNPTIYNMTLVGNYNIPDGGGEGILLRRGTGISMKNSIVTNFQKAAVDIDNEATFARINSGNLAVQNCIFYNNLAGAEFNADETDEPEYTPPFTTEDVVMNPANHNSIVDPLLNNISIQTPDLRPASYSPALSGATTISSDGFFVENADFIGAFESQYDWTKGWSSFGGTLSKMPVPSGIQAYEYYPQHYPYTSANPKLARPISFGFMERGELDFRVGLHAFEAPMDIYIAFGMPDGVLYVVDENFQGHPYTDGMQMPAWRRSQTHSIYENLCWGSGISWPSGWYAGVVLAVPAGMNPAAVTAGYLWVFQMTL